jgi:hypothetical protein
MAESADLQTETTISGFLEEYDRIAVTAGAPAALSRLSQLLASAPPPWWQACALRLQRRGANMVAAALLERAVNQVPADASLRLSLGRALMHLDDHASAEAVLRPIAGPDDEEAITALTATLRNQGKLSEAAQLTADLILRHPADLDTSLTRLRFINGCQRQALAKEMCERELARGLRHPTLLSFAGRLATTTGHFEQARGYYLDAIEAGADLNTDFILQALSGTQRYSNREHPDFKLFERHLAGSDLNELGRASVLFGQGKAYDDIGDVAAAATALRQGNALVKRSLSWTPTGWNTTMERLTTTRYPVAESEEARAFTPVFVVGLPRSGTTLVADRLGRHPQLRNRGELNLVPYLDQWVSSSGQAQNPKLLQAVSRFAAAQLRQDDAPAQYYLDKNPLNFRFLGLIASVLPGSRIIWCRRNPRDTALSIWSQYFARGDDNGYAYDFADIAAFTAGCERLMGHWRSTLPLPVHEVQYEDLIRAPQESFATLMTFLGLPEFELDPLVATSAKGEIITTSSAWQARQPIYTRSIERWRAYEPYLPELVAHL